MSDSITITLASNGQIYSIKRQSDGSIFMKLMNPKRGQKEASEEDRMRLKVAADSLSVYKPTQEWVKKTKSWSIEKRLKYARDNNLVATMVDEYGGKGGSSSSTSVSREKLKDYGIDESDLDDAKTDAMQEVSTASKKSATAGKTTASKTKEKDTAEAETSHEVASSTKKAVKAEGAKFVPASYEASIKDDGDMPLTLKYMLGFKDQDIKLGEGSNPVYGKLNRMLGENAGYTLSSNDDDMMCAFGANAVATMVAKAHGETFDLPENNTKKDTNYKTAIMWENFGPKITLGNQEQGDWIAFDKGLSHIGVYVGETASDWLVAGFRNTERDHNGKILSRGVRVVKIPKTYKPEFRRQEYDTTAVPENIA